MFVSGVMIKNSNFKLISRKTVRTPEKRKEIDLWKEEDIFEDQIISFDNDQKDHKVQIFWRSKYEK